MIVIVKSWDETLILRNMESRGRFKILGPKDGGNKYRRNVGNTAHIYTVQKTQERSTVKVQNQNYISWHI
jgi:hypothetical protein